MHSPVREVDVAACRVARRHVSGHPRAEVNVLSIAEFDDETPPPAKARPRERTPYRRVLCRRCGYAGDYLCHPVQHGLTFLTGVQGTVEK